MHIIRWRKESCPIGQSGQWCDITQDGGNRITLLWHLFGWSWCDIWTVCPYDDPVLPVNQEVALASLVAYDKTPVMCYAVAKIKETYYIASTTTTTKITSNCKSLMRTASSHLTGKTAACARSTCPILQSLLFWQPLCLVGRLCIRRWKYRN